MTTNRRTLTFDPAKWRPEKPAKEGAYYVKGFHLGHPEYRVLVEVREVDGELCSNMNDVDNWWPIADHSSRFLWLGPLVPEAAAPEPAAGVSELLKDCYYNLEGVIMDAEREGFDAVCLKTIKYVQEQITKTAAAARGK